MAPAHGVMTDAAAITILFMALLLNDGKKLFCVPTSSLRALLRKKMKKAGTF
jgi:hypothetical protein